MQCPKCRRKMEIMWEEPTGEKMCVDGTRTIEVVGHCWNCDYDGRWNIDISPDGKEFEYNLERFYFG